ncbi:hypothetical protein QC762_0047930 [Podospora pseudocomata]|uniref:Uncharacterized protein n=1 Tax=Podospora pseudocomata TaxID=2093779 RepID=A0ABR0GI31_9PEZI|nr:hypothetical protein QC762_0047930 [Podospora pseudocomata]
MISLAEFLPTIASIFCAAASDIAASIPSAASLSIARLFLSPRNEIFQPTMQRSSDRLHILILEHHPILLVRNELVSLRLLLGGLEEKQDFLDDRLR